MLDVSPVLGNTGTPRGITSSTMVAGATTAGAGTGAGFTTGAP